MFVFLVEYHIYLGESSERAVYSISIGMFHKPPEKNAAVGSRQEASGYVFFGLNLLGQTRGVGFKERLRPGLKNSRFLSI